MKEINNKKNFKKKYILVSTLFIFLRQTIVFFWQIDAEFILNMIMYNMFFVNLYLIYLFIYEGFFAPIYNLNELLKKRIDFHKYNVYIIIINVLFLIHTLYRVILLSYSYFYSLWK